MNKLAGAADAAATQRWRALTTYYPRRACADCYQSLGFARRRRPTRREYQRPDSSEESTLPPVGIRFRYFPVESHLGQSVPAARTTAGFDLAAPVALTPPRWPVPA